MNINQFLGKWSKTELKERAASQEHFIDLCQVLEHPTPAEADPVGEKFCFERGAKKQDGSNGWADVWKRQFFAWEYKSKKKHRDFAEAYAQLNRYRESLENPPVLIVCDIAKYEIHTNFTGTATEVHKFAHEDLTKPQVLSLLRNVFYHPEKLKPSRTPTDVTEEAVREFCKIGDRLLATGTDPHDAAHFLMKMVFCLFAEDVDLLPKGLFAEMVAATANTPKEFSRYARELFDAMAHGGKFFLLKRIPYFDGGLFADSDVVELDCEDLQLLARVSKLDWSNIEPAIFGTLLERSLNPEKRTQLGAHYTSREDIISLVEPVLMAPLRKEWQVAREELGKLRVKMAATPSGRRYKKVKSEFESKSHKFLERLRHVKVLDPACGSGNFLYISLKLLKDLEKEVITFAASAGTMNLFPLVQPDQLHGIEIDPYAQELASIVVWIGYIQWMRDNGFTINKDPILQPLNNVLQRDAVLGRDRFGKPIEPDWPRVDVIVGNPPFLGGKLLRRQLGNKYVDDLFKLYEGRVPREADFVCYWFEKARGMVQRKMAERAGLLGTQGIRGGSNRRVLERIKETGNIFFAISDRDWMLDGAMVHVSMVGFDDGAQSEISLDGKGVTTINPDLTTGVDVTRASQLPCNKGISFMGDSKGGAFDIPSELAQKILRMRNPHGRSNRDVVKRWVNGSDLYGEPRDKWIIDFGTEMSKTEAALYEGPFEYVKKHVKPERDKNNRPVYREKWWIHVEPRPAMRKALEGLPRFIGTTRHSKYRLFAWLTPSVLPDSALIVFARADDYCFGILHSRVHEVWSRQSGTQLREEESGARYTPTTTFETFPFPWPLGQESGLGQECQEGMKEIANAAAALNKLREVWLGPIDKRGGSGRTLTILYNEGPTWLSDAHSTLDRAVLKAYGWPVDLSEAEILDRLLKLNVTQAKAIE